ncbi:hypothetical protein F6B42_03715 [Microbacterium radiodurans]|uniref:Uncharacterized protein n=1 Tax=Microbacterium radiodurans TaxID=661398 RepID=A0A5J5IWS7_9MICO|nr:hypothetical protein F6B42_03715 [Microbacterium radiodurans]
MRWWRTSIRTWSGPAFPLLIMQIFVCGAMVVTNGLGLLFREYEPIRVWFLAGFGSLLIWWVATFVGVLRQRASDRRAAEQAT